MDPTLFNNLLADFRNSIFTIISTSGTTTQQIGFSILSALVTIMAVMAGIRVMYHDHHAFHKLRLFTGIVLLVWIIMRLYTTQSALLGGTSFSEMIPRFAFGLADQVGISIQQEMIAKLKQILDGAQSSSGFMAFLHVRDTIQYITITVLVGFLELVMFVVVGFGYLALGALIAIGPVLIPFLLVPKLDFLFWGWLRAMMKYSFYPVIGNLVLLVICKLMLATLNSTVLAGNASAGAIVLNISQVPLILILFVAAVYAIFKIPSLVTDIFNGTASAGQGVQQAVTSAVAAAAF
jgi:hypothetical protein